MRFLGGRADFDPAASTPAAVPARHSSAAALVALWHGLTTRGWSESWDSDARRAGGPSWHAGQRSDSRLRETAGQLAPEVAMNRRLR
jgi:hypothetical protein